MMTQVASRPPPASVRTLAATAGRHGAGLQHATNIQFSVLQRKPMGQCLLANLHFVHHSSHISCLGIFYGCCAHQVASFNLENMLQAVMKQNCYITTQSMLDF